MLRTAFIIVILLLALSACNQSQSDYKPIIEVSQKNKVTNYKYAINLDDLLEKFKNKDTIYYSSIDSILKLNIFLKQKLVNQIAISDSVSAYVVSKNHTSLTFVTFENNKLKDGFDYKFDIEFIDNRVQFFRLFNFKSQVDEIKYVENYNVFVLMGVKDADKIEYSNEVKSSFITPGDSTRRKIGK